MFFLFFFLTNDWDPDPVKGLSLVILGNLGL